MKILKNGTVTSAKGYLAVGENIGIKKSGKKDLGLLLSERPAIAAGTFTTNVVKAAPVLWDQEIVEKQAYVRMIAVNSGVANACTGQEGIENNAAFASVVADSFGFKAKEILICSTGVIGKQLPMATIQPAIPKLVNKLTISGGYDLAKAILTTDTKEKNIAVSFKLKNKEVVIGGCCKGSGMIHPNMATMLAFITTDANITKELLNQALKEVVPDTFNMISVDRDTSTNDTVLLLANGLADNELISQEGEAYQSFKEALYYVLEHLAKQIAADGEGATKLLEVQVKKAQSISLAKQAAKSVCTSPLVKTAIFGNDANWGRFLCSLGYSGIDFDPNQVELYLSGRQGELQLVASGMATDYSEEEASKILADEYVTVTIVLNQGESQATAWGCDLTYDYVRINADYRS